MNDLLAGTNHSGVPSNWIMHSRQRNAYNGKKLRAARKEATRERARESRHSGIAFMGYILVP